MAIYEIPLSKGNQKFSVQLLNTYYNITLIYRSGQGGGWVMDIADSSGNPLVNGIALVTGSDLLGQHKHLGFGGALFIQTDGDPDAVPTYQSLGVTSRMYFETYS